MAAVLGSATIRAMPVVRQVLERRSGRNPVLRIADLGVVHIAAYGANILFHLHGNRVYIIRVLLKNFAYK